MPGIVTHYVFGCEVYRRLAFEIGEGERERNAFLLGNQGPDPLFYLVVAPMASQYRSLASMLHKRDTAKLLYSMHQRFTHPYCSRESQRGFFGTRSTDYSGKVLRAYALGFTCHFLLDSMVHPLVYAQQNAICAYGVKGLRGRRAARAVHATIETEFDEYVMTTHLGVTMSQLLPHKVALPCASPDLEGISCELAAAVRLAYGERVPSRLFELAVRLNRVGQAALDSKGAGLRRRFDYLQPTGLASAYVLSLSHVNKPRPTTPFANDDRIPWPHPSKQGEACSASFDDLYKRAFDRACEELPSFAVGNPALSRFRMLTGGVNFLGKPLH